ncbi:DUF3043 domain-containing protein [Boudabousia marimammalium]|uniref:DUF3043 domain-containing protein n=1 Tax=Boudabousia marimammalium TaxID=156892 RepID=A0A1Q5PQT7_9ACTO|nr:DUF3043 domain-containing protein [Boudabousia marimammalium]OKL49927.1 hypothetical protein BM477_03210 [Boudabousia marimammalium]
MTVFGKKKESASESPVEETQSSKVGKGRPTPKRKEAEAARRRPVIVGDPKQRRKLSKEERKRERERRDAIYARQQEAMRVGDERYLPARDKGKPRRFMRDFVDSRYTVAEWMIPVAVLSLFASMLLVNRQNIHLYVVYGTYLVFLFAILESILYWSRAKKQMETNHPKWEIPPHSWWYMFSRMLMPRRWRRPNALANRGEKPE